MFTPSKEALLAESVRLGLNLVDPILFDGDEAKIEHLIHEVGHAISLNIPVKGNIGPAIEKRLDAEGHLFAIKNEALVLAAEAAVLSEIGIREDDAELRASLVEAGEIQEIPASMLRQLFGSPAARALAASILRFLSNIPG